MNTNNKKVYIQNFWYVNNYGACLTAYALYTILTSLKHEVKLIDISNTGEKLSYVFRSFIKQYCKTTPQIQTYADLRNIIDTNAVYITGSDQVFRPYLAKNNLSKFLFDYISSSKKIAVSASFGKNKEEFLQENCQNVIEKMKNSLSSFDTISVREKSGLEICKEVFNINAEWIIDPVFILDKTYFEALANSGCRNSENYIASCMFEKKNNKIDKFLSKKYNCKVIELHQSRKSIENWLMTIKNCNFLITNSYHAMCFAIIFNKPFIALSKDMGASSRFDSICEMLGIENQCISSIDEIYNKDCIFKVDYGKVNEKIEEERQRGLEFLKKAIEAPICKQKEKEEIRTRYLEEKVRELEKQTNLKCQLKIILWNTWLIIFHRCLPESIKNIIRKCRGKNG